MHLINCNLLSLPFIIVFMICSFGPGEIEGLVCYKCTGFDCGLLKTTTVQTCNETNPVCIIGNELISEVVVKNCMEKSNAEEFKKAADEKFKYNAAKVFVICDTDKCNSDIGIVKAKKNGLRCYKCVDVSDCKTSKVVKQCEETFTDPVCVTIPKNGEAKQKSCMDNSAVQDYHKAHPNFYAICNNDLCNDRGLSNSGGNGGNQGGNYGTNQGDNYRGNHIGYRGNQGNPTGGDFRFGLNVGWLDPSAGLLTWLLLCRFSLWFVIGI